MYNSRLSWFKLVQTGYTGRWLGKIPLTEYKYYILQVLPFSGWSISSRFCFPDTYTYIHTYLYIHTYMLVYIHPRTHTHIHIHTYIRTYIYIRTSTRGAQKFPLPDNILAEKSGKRSCSHEYITYILTHHFIWRRSRRKIPIQSAGAKTALTGSRVRLVMALRMKTNTLKPVGSIRPFYLRRKVPVRSAVSVSLWSNQQAPNEWTTATWEPDKAPHLSCQQRLCLRRRKRNQKTAKQETTEGIKKAGNGKSGCPCIKWMRVISERQLPAAYHSNPENNIFKTNLSFRILYEPISATSGEQINLVIQRPGLDKMFYGRYLVAQLSYPDADIPFHSLQPSHQEGKRCNQHRVLPSCILPTAWWHCGWGGFANWELGACSLF